MVNERKWGGSLVGGIILAEGPKSCLHYLAEEVVRCLTFVNSEYGTNVAGLEIRSVVPYPVELYLVVKTPCQFSWQCTWL